jgi:hypothetical protein
VRGRFADIPGCDWGIEVTHAVRVPLEERVDDLDEVRNEFRGWLSPARTTFDDGIAFTAVAASYDEAVRFQRAVTELIARKDLYVVVVLVRREQPGARWERIDEPPQVSDEEIEDELRVLGQQQDGVDDA